jgi:N-acetylglutamate synthase-like GNAT family acetyltransferase
MDSRRALSPWLAAVFVDPAYRRQGIGRRLCREVEARARRLEFEKLHLFTPDRERFYERMGWSTVERDVYRGQDVAIMEKTITAGSG